MGRLRRNGGGEDLFYCHKGENLILPTDLILSTDVKSTDDMYVHVCTYIVIHYVCSIKGLNPI